MGPWLVVAPLGLGDRGELVMPPVLLLLLALITGVHSQPLHRRRL